MPTPRGFAACFTEDAVYHDYIYGPHAGRAEIARMLGELFLRDAGDDYRWEMFDAVCDGNLGLRLVAVVVHLDRARGSRAGRW